MRSARKKTDEILSMSQRELLSYLRGTDDTLQPSDLIQIIPFEHGVKAMYYHKNFRKPFKTRVFLRNVDNSEQF